MLGAPQLAVAHGSGAAGSAPRPFAAAGQPPGSGGVPLTRTTTIAALNAYPLFFHGHNVRIRATQSATDPTYLTYGERRVVAYWTPGTTAPAGDLEVTGTFWDVGRLEADDPRVAAANIGTLSQRLLQKPWPGTGELLLIAVRVAVPAQPARAATLRAVALEPERFEGQRVTVTGRFRGRNLYGDLPTSPGQGRFEFVLQSSDASVWVTGLQPKGKDFNLNPAAKVDTGHWLQVSGTVKTARGLTWIEGTNIALSTAPVETAAAPTPKRAPEPAPEVVFSLPTEAESDVATDVVVRIQFSRDMRPESFRDRVRLSYATAEALERGEPQAPETPFVVDYDPGNRVIVVRPKKPLERFRTVRIELLEGITAIDGAPLAPWTLTFTLGG